MCKLCTVGCGQEESRKQPLCKTFPSDLHNQIDEKIYVDIVFSLDGTVKWASNCSALHLDDHQKL